jgi:hypothetical protein
VLVVSGAGLLAVVSWTVCSAVVSWARTGSVRMEVSRLVSCQPTHSMGGVASTRAKTSAFVAGICHRTTRYLLVGPATHSKRKCKRGPAGRSCALQGLRTSLKPDHYATDDAKVRDDERELELPRNDAGNVGDLSFAVFSLAHAECGEEGTIELRLDERLLVGWCPLCAALETFGSPG